MIFYGKMTYSYGQDKLPHITVDTTFDAILTGVRTATTRYDHIDYWSKAQIGDIIIFSSADGRTVECVVTKPLFPLKGSGMTPKQWCMLEGWSVAYCINNVVPKLASAFQIQFKLLK